MEIGDWLGRNCIAHRLNADSKRQALAAISEIAGRCFGIAPAEILDALIDREAEGSTGVGNGVALPHARLPGLDRMRAVFVRLESPVDFGALDDQPVDLMFALFAPVGANSEHLRALARVSRLLRQSSMRERLRKARSVDAIRALLAQETSSSAA